jgi:hypothetical protein
MLSQKAKRHAVLSAALGLLLGGGVSARYIAAQEREVRNQESQPQTPGRTDFPFDELTENWVIIRLAERSTYTPEIKVAVKDSVATLSGRVPSEETKRRAARIAGFVTGVTVVRNELNVDRGLQNKGETNVSNSDLERQVAQAIAAKIAGAKSGQDWWFDGWRVEGEFNRWRLVVNVDQPGHVVLQGNVPQLDIMRNAIEAGAQVPGVRALDSDLEFAPRFYGGYA